MNTKGLPIDDGESAEQFSTMEFIAEARRPLLIERHRTLIEETETSLSDQLVTGEADNPRLKSMLDQLTNEAEVGRINGLIQTLASDSHYKDATLRSGLVDELCLLREQKGVEVATLQLHIIGVYRQVRVMMISRQGDPPGLSDLREMPATILGRLINPIKAEFGTPGLSESLVHTPSFADRCTRTIKRIRRAEKGSSTWEEANGEPPLPREVEQPLEGLPENERKATRALLIGDRIRSQFYKDVFLRFLNRNELDPKETESHRTVLHWLESIEATAHLYPFMQGQTAGQKAYRLGQLLGKIIQIHEMYARVALASQHPTYREPFKAKNTRERLAIMAKDHYPVLAMTPELMLAALLCPFPTFVEWVQGRVETQDFVLPPDSKR
ncbi:MAG: hypothetical protein H0W83_07045 [Planctomycetes bacterium]|nr:hypothetical protein [Planctomycetota bacterium]